MLSSRAQRIQSCGRFNGSLFHKIVQTYCIDLELTLLWERIVQWSSVPVRTLHRRAKGILNESMVETTTVLVHLGGVVWPFWSSHTFSAGLLSRVRHQEHTSAIDPEAELIDTVHCAVISCTNVHICFVLSTETTQSAF